MLLLQTLLGCTPAVPPTPQLSLQPYLYVSMVVRAEQNPAWTARIEARTQNSHPQDVVAGQCVPLPSEAEQTFETAPWASTATLSLPESMPLTWDNGVWRTTGPLLGREPAWVTADLGWYNGQNHTASGVVRFGETPEIQTVERQQDGSVRLRWKSRTANKHVILTRATDTGITLVCGTMRDGADIPAWAAAPNSTLLLRSTRTRVSEQDHTLIVGEATIEQPILLDAPLPEAPQVTPARPQIPDTHRSLGQLKKKRDRKG